MRYVLAPLVVALATGCGATLPAVGEAKPHAFLIREAERGPIVVMFGGYLTSAADLCLGMRQSAMLVAERMQGSVAVFPWNSLDLAKEWCAREGWKRREAGEAPEYAIAGHSWGGHSACKLTEHIIDTHAGGPCVSALITLDAANHGYCLCALEITMAVATFEYATRQRHGFISLRRTPVPDGERLVRHINYYQRDSRWLHGTHIDTATENHLVWLDSGHEVGHGNLDGILAELVAEDVRRSFDRKWSAP